MFTLRVAGVAARSVGLGGEERAGAAEFEDEISDDRQIEDEEDEFRDGGVTMNFPEFDGDKRSGEDKGKVLGPTLAQGKTNTLGEGESGVKESDTTE